MRDPLYKIQQRAFDQTLSPELRVEAIRELGARHAEQRSCPSGSYGATYQRRLAAAYVRGFLGGPVVEAGFRRGGNWNRPLQSAYNQGLRDAIEIRLMVMEEGAAPHLPKAVKS